MVGSILDINGLICAMSGRVLNPAKAVDWARFSTQGITDDPQRVTKSVREMVNIASQWLKLPKRTAKSSVRFPHFPHPQMRSLGTDTARTPSPHTRRKQ